MSEYKAYQHIEKLTNTDEIEGLLNGTCYIQPKIDGTNGKVWFENGSIHCGSRTRELSQTEDNQGFCQYVYQNREKFEKFYNENSKSFAIFGEWLIKNKIKNYKQDSYRHFYIFDILDTDTGKYMEWGQMSDICKKYEFDCIPVMGIVENPTEEQLTEFINSNHYLFPEGSELIGEGIIIKNLDFVNKYGRRTWGKIVTADFKKKDSPKSTRPQDYLLEKEIAEKYLDSDIVEKIYYRLLSENDNVWNNKLIGRFLGSVWHDFVTEQIWDILKKFHKPVIDFNLLEKQVTLRTKEIKPECFQ